MEKTKTTTFLKKAVKNQNAKCLFKNIKECYLIDYENVLSNGLAGIGNLKKGSVICIFYTKKANRISIDAISAIERKKVKICFIEAYNGYKNALDFQMVSFLGYLISRHQTMNIKIRYRIITKDNGFRSTVAFWKNLDMDVEQQIAIDPKIAETKRASIQVNKNLKNIIKKQVNVKEPKTAKTEEEFKDFYKYLLSQFIVKTADIILDCAIQSDCSVHFREQLVKHLGEKFAIVYYQTLKKKFPRRNNPNPQQSKK